MGSKPQIAFESKAQADEKAQHTAKYVSILKRSVMHLSVIELARIPLRGATQLSDARWGFETTSSLVSGYSSEKNKGGSRVEQEPH